MTAKAYKIADLKTKVVEVEDGHVVSLDELSEELGIKITNAYVVDDEITCHYDEENQ